MPQRLGRDNCFGSISRTATLVTLGLVLAAVATIWWIARTPDLRQIDTSVTIQDAVVPALPLNKNKPLRVVIAAMISPERTANTYSQVMQLIGERLGRPVEISQRKTYAEANAMLKNHKVDLAMVCSGAYVEGKDTFGMELLVAPVVHGKKIYYSYIIVPKGSPAKRLDDLRGKRFAFTDPKSNTGFLVPSYMLAQQQKSPENFFSDSFFTYSHDNSIHAVAEGLADGAAVDSLVWDYLDATGSPDTRRTSIIEKSPPYGIPPIVVHPELDGQLKRTLRSAFSTLHTDPKAKELLRNLQIDRFEATDDSMYATVRQMARWLMNNPVGKATP